MLSSQTQDGLVSFQRALREAMSLHDEALVLEPRSGEAVAALVQLKCIFLPTRDLFF